MGDDLDRIIEAMQNTINEDTRAAWGEEAYERWVNPPNMGAMPDADGKAELRGTCGDSMAISLKFDGDRVCAALFETDGCGPSVVCGSLAAEMAVGKSAEELLDITGEMVLARAGQIPDDHYHCAFLAVSTLHEALSGYMRLALEKSDANFHTTAPAKKREGGIMPAGNGTGPMGMGSMTGRGAGYCSGSGTPGYANGGFGGGGFGFGGGRGRRNRFYAAAPQGRFAGQQAFDPATEKQALKNQVQTLQAQLEAIQKRLAEME